MDQGFSFTSQDQLLTAGCILSSCGFYKNALRTEICLQKGLSCRKDSALLYIHHKSYCVQELLSFQAEEFRQTFYFLKKHRFLLTYQTKCVENCCTSCFFLSFRFQYPLLKGARTIFPHTALKCRRKHSIAEIELKSKTSLPPRVCALALTQSTQKPFCHDWLQMEL